jgi:hypothetical protein
VSDPANPPEPPGFEQILADHQRQLVEAHNATEAALRQLKAQLGQLERNQIAIAAQRSLLESLQQAITATRQAAVTEAPSDHHE